MYLISIAALRRNAAILRGIREAADCKVVLAMKGFSCWKAFRYLRDDLDGCCASGLWEGELARKHFGKAVITYSPAYSDQDIRELAEFSHHLDFNSLSQWMRFREFLMAHPRYVSGELHCGLRINPEHSTGATPLYDPCVDGSRLGIPAANFVGADLTGISGLHFHTLCEQGAEDLESTLAAVEERFGDLLRSPEIRYLNMGGGHWITKPDYNRELLVSLVRHFQEKYDLEVWLEPGEAAAIHTGVLRAEVMDVFAAGSYQLAILDVSATAHMPDVIEMPYRPDVYLVGGSLNARAEVAAPAVAIPGENYELAGGPEGAHLYRIGGPTCLAGDVIGDFSFSRPLVPGDRIVFDDMSHYTMVKTTMFNGVKHPAIAFQHEDGRIEVVREFSFEDFERHLS